MKFSNFLGDNEVIKQVIEAERKYEKGSQPGSLVFTNYRLLFFRIYTQKDEIYLIDSLLFDEIKTVLFEPNENWIKINNLKYRPMKGTPGNVINNLEKIISEKPAEPLNSLSIHGKVKYSNTHRFFDFLASAFALPMTILSILLFASFFYSLFDPVLFSFVISICGIVFVSLLAFDKRKYPYYELEGNRLKETNDKRSMILAGSIVALVFSCISGFFYISMNPLEGTIGFYPLNIGFNNIGNLLSFGFGITSIFISISNALEFSNIFRAEPTWIGTDESPMSVKKVESTIKNFGIAIGILLGFAVALFVIYQGQLIFNYWIAGLNPLLWYIIAQILQIAGIICGLCAFGFLVIRIGLFFFSFLFGSTLRLIEPLDKMSTNVIEKGKGLLTTIGDKVRDSFQKIGDDLNIKIQMEKEKQKERQQQRADRRKRRYERGWKTQEVEIPSKITIEEDVVSTPTGMKEVFSAKEAKGSVEVTRGGIIQGASYSYKIKIENNTDSVITDIKALLTSYPSDSLALLTDEVQKRNKIEPNGDFIALTYNFKPSSDCIAGRINSIVTYMDAKGESQQIMVAPHEVKMICGLLQPASVTIEEFENITKGLLEFTKSGEDVEVPFNVKLLYSKILMLLPENNFQLVSNELIEVGSNYVGIIKGYAEGKYTHNKVGMMITITGGKTLPYSSAKIEAYTQDKAMLVPILSEISESLTIMKCNQCGASFEETQVKNLADGKTITCNFCGESISPKI